MFGGRSNSNQARICVLGFSAFRVWLVNRFYIFIGRRYMSGIRRIEIIVFVGNRPRRINNFFIHRESSPTNKINFIRRECRQIKIIIFFIRHES